MHEGNRYHELDSLRAIAAMGVITWHYTSLFKASPLSFAMTPFYRHGLLFVDFFFVLSGFVMARAYWRENRRSDVIQNVRGRFARLYPLHFSTLLVVAVLQWILIDRMGAKTFGYAFNDRYDFLLHLFLLNSTGLEHGFGFNAASWSISTEFIVNILFLCVIALPRRFAKLSILAMFVSGVIMLIEQDGGTCTLGNVCYVNNGIFRTLIGFTAGAATYGLYARTFVASPLPRTEADALGLLAIAATLTYFNGHQYSVYSDMAATIFLFPLIILATVQSNLLKRTLNFAPLVFLGEISYSIYLVNFPLELAINIVDIRYHLGIDYRRPRIFIAVMALTVLASALTYFLIELPGKRLIASPRGKKMGASTAHQAAN